MKNGKPKLIYLYSKPNSNPGFSHPSIEIRTAETTLVRSNDLIRIESQCDTDRPTIWRCYATRIVRVEFPMYASGPDPIALLPRVVKGAGWYGLRPIIKNLRKLGIPRYVFADVGGQYQLIPRRFARHAAAYIQARDAGII